MLLPLLNNNTQKQLIMAKQIIKIDSNGSLVQLNQKLGRWEHCDKAWSWDDISKGYKRESRRNYKANR